LSEIIRECAPKTLQEWEQYYLSQTQLPGIKQMLGGTMEEHLEEVGRRLYVKISEQLRAEIEEVTEDDCIRYVREVVIDRTYEGYETEKETVYKQLKHLLGIKLQPAPDEWDRAYSVDFYIPIGNKSIGIQIKPTTYMQTPEPHNWRQWMQDSHQRFTKKHGGQVFIVFSVKKGKTKEIANPEVIEEIRQEMVRLRGI
jgi:hypothetical protein